MLHASAQLRLEFHIRQEQINTQCNPDLRHDCILTGADERFDLQILFDPFKNQLDLPSGLVDIGNGPSGQFEIVGQKNIMLATLGISVTDTAQLDRTCL